jgi:phage-related protein
MITWHGISSEDVGVGVEHYPNIPIPARRQTLLPVPGRNGGILITEDAFDNVIMNYDIYIKEAANMAVVTRSVLQWLLYPGYQELVDSYDTGVTRYAFFDTTDPIESTLNRFGRVTLAFNCKPQRYITEALTPELYTAPLDNPTLNEARPLIVCHGSGTGTLTVGNNTVNLLDCEIVLDCENQQAYYDGTNMNDKMEGEFPVLPIGTTGISYTGGVTSVEIAPRWYYL